LWHAAGLSLDLERREPVYLYQAKAKGEGATKTNNRNREGVGCGLGWPKTARVDEAEMNNGYPLFITQFKLLHKRHCLSYLSFASIE
jgi:hypothetical protein